MSQYRRIVSYLYRYVNGQKEQNTGYAKVELKGEDCRVFVQMRFVPVEHPLKVYFYIQHDEGIETIYIGQMQMNATGMECKENSSIPLFGSVYSLEDIDGIFIYDKKEQYFATSWKKDFFLLGGWKEEADKMNLLNGQKIEKEESKVAESSEEKRATYQKALPLEDGSRLEETKAENAKKEDTVPWKQASKIPVKEENKEETDVEQTAVRNYSLAEETEMETVCRICPFKRKELDFGKKILQSFPRMSPFTEGTVESCVRLELQDLGCFPIHIWQLSGNRFLLHGYYNYRHLIFAEFPSHKYMLGVPGIYSEKEKITACQFGFSKFQSIGDFGCCHGAFGYWLMEIVSSEMGECLEGCKRE